MKLNNIIALVIMLFIGISVPVYAEDEAVSMYEQPQLERGEILFSQSRRVVDSVNPTPSSNYAQEQTNLVQKQ